ncbi:MAG: DUF2007 domain-containing protein [Ectothiorhodospiraceae bacterium]|nr:DUF2007 domain-containing protein [Ectothiorhodospiraceae bacterium]MCH8503070.1 DUF2007 domain-containing protein [Ectothiorhodospiraceae bacterium]
MKLVYSSHSPLLVGHMRNILESEGIRCVCRNMMLVGGAGELPPTAVWPELWVEREIDYERAERLIREAQAPSSGGEGWTCPGCGERLEPQFTECWQCGRSRPKR